MGLCSFISILPIFFLSLNLAQELIYFEGGPGLSGAGASRVLIKMHLSLETMVDLETQDIGRLFYISKNIFPKSSK